jgi:hypothetical protein
VRRRGIRVAAVAALIALAAAAPAQAAGLSRADPVTVAGAGRAADSGPGLANVAVLDVVMLVDESGSETPAKVAAEKQTAGTIVQSMLNSRSRVTVVGFGGVNHVAPNQSPVDVVCQPTIASGAVNLSYLASCVSGLHRRTEQEGDDTDYAAALGQANSYLSLDSRSTPPSPNGAIKVILMMTDGTADVHRNTQQYGTNWMAGEQQALNQQLAIAKMDGVQVWPLGFGTDIGGTQTQAQALSYLNQIAASGAPAVCDTRHVANQPHATWVNNPPDAINALNQLYADAACLGTNSTGTTIGGGVQNGTLSVTIPAIASDAVISVDSGDPGVQVGFTRPDGQSWTDSSAISGQDSSVEVLHVATISSSEVGTWRIHLAAPPGLASQLVSATVFWQGAARALITANPPSAKLGQPISVTLSVLGPSGPIIDPATLKSLLVGVTVSGDGLPSPVQIPISPAGESAGSATGLGGYTGTFTAPNQQGTLTFTGAAAGYGLYATQVPATVTVSNATAGFTASAQFPVVASVLAGDSITGHVIFTNQTGVARHVSLVLSTSGAIAFISPSVPVTAPSGNPPAVPFTVTFSKDSPAGSAWLEVKVVDAANPGLVYNEAMLNVTVTRPPGFLSKYLWDIIGIIALIILAILAILWLRAVIRSRKDVRGLVAILRRNGEQLGGELKAPNRWSDVFRFVIRDETEPTARLDFPQSGLSEYRVRRSGPSEVKLMTPAGGEPYDVVVGGPGETMDHNGLELAFRDTRRPRSGRGGGRGPGRRTPAPQPTPQSPTPQPYDADVTRTIPSAPSVPRDEWL